MADTPDTATRPWFAGVDTWTVSQAECAACGWLGQEVFDVTEAQEQADTHDETVHGTPPRPEPVPIIPDPEAARMNAWMFEPR